MTAVTVIERQRPYTKADLEAMPDDGRRYELIDGVLIVTPSPTRGHQGVLRELFPVVHHATPPGFEIFFAPLNVELADDTVMQPDLLVTRPEDLGTRVLEKAPLLAVEVLSPSTRRFDLTVKRSRLEEAGCPSYWVVDPQVPRLISWELRDGEYVEVADVSGDEPFEAPRPFPVTVVPNALID